MPLYSPSHQSPDFSIILIIASFGKPIVSGVVEAKSYKATTWSIIPDGRVGFESAGASMVFADVSSGLLLTALSGDLAAVGVVVGVVVAAAAAACLVELVIVEDATDESFCLLEDFGVEDTGSDKKLKFDY